MKKTKEFDPLQKLEGRGFYICLDCAKTKGKKLEKVAINKQELINKLKKQIINQIQLGWRSRLIKIGLEDTINEIKKGKNGFVIVATDFSQRSMRKLMNVFNGKVYKFLTKVELGKTLGKQEIGIIFLPYNKFSQKLENLLNQYLTLEGGSSSCRK